MRKRRFSKTQLIPLLLLVVIGAALIVFGALGIRDYVRTTSEGEPYPSDGVVATTDVASERPILVTDTEYTVADTQPRRVMIESISVDAYVQKVGVDKSGAMATPSNINFVGWYVDSPIPGESGVSILNGHVGGRYTDGVFKHIKDIQPADSIKIQMGDLTWREFKVVSNTSYPVEQSASPLFKKSTEFDKELHLITCSGKFDDRSQTYDERTILVARYIEK